MSKVRQKKGHFLLVILAIAVSALILSSCESQETKFIKAYGHEKAYITTDSGKLFKLESGYVTYYYMGYTEGYNELAQYACKKASEASSVIDIRFKEVDKNDAVYRFKAISDPQGDFYAQNSIATDANGTIYGSIITFNYSLMNGLSLKGKYHVVVHEMGHTLGLNDRKESATEANTIMYFTYTGKYTFEDYTKFDKENITWHYGK